MNLNKFFKDLTIQDYITLGYLYLIIIGVINIVIYYTSLNINIFDYIAITDILLAPINMLFLSPQNTVLIIIVISIVTYFSKFLILGLNTLIEKATINNSKYLFKISYQPTLIFMILFSYIFLVLSINMADRVSLRVKNKTYKLNTTLTFTDNTQKDVCVVATTSLYIFYVEKGENVVAIMPISGNVKSIKDIIIQ